MKKRKPNYKLRRRIALIIIILIIVVPILIITREKISHIPIYIGNFEYRNIVSTFFSIDFNKNEVEDIMNKLKKEDKISKINKDMIVALHNKGYSNSTINFILLNMSKIEIRKLLNKEYSKDLETYLSIDLFNYDHYERYLDYQSYYPNLSLEDVVIRVELKQDKDNYEDSEEEKNPDSYTALINKHRYLNKNYEPKDLVDMEDEYSNNNHSVNKLRKEAYEQFKKMVDDAKKEDITFYAETTYRSYETQDDIYYEYVYYNGADAANLYAAKAGYSEHELGTAIDLANVWNIEEDDPEYKWIERNAYKYGYIIRYKKEDEDITGYSAEPWHIRYVGLEAANKIYKQKLTLDEYWIKYVNKKD